MVPFYVNARVLFFLTVLDVHCVVSIDWENMLRIHFQTVFKIKFIKIYMCMHCTAYRQQSRPYELNAIGKTNHKNKMLIAAAAYLCSDESDSWKLFRFQFIKHVAE